MPHKLLLADDSVTIQRVIELTFADEDVQVTVVSDGRHAIERLKADRPDIVLADIGMPEKDGYEVAAFIKSDPQLAHIPVMLLTGAFEPLDENRARSVGCDGVLVKPFEPQMVINRVKELLGAVRPPAATAPAARSAGHMEDLEALLSAPTPARVEPKHPAGESLEDYFDRLDAAFANLGAPPGGDKPQFEREDLAAGLDELHTPPPQAPAETEDPLSTWDPELTSDVAPADQPRADISRADISAADFPAADYGSARQPHLANAFAALLAAEEGHPLPPGAAVMAPSAPGLTDDVIEDIVGRVIARMSTDTVRRTVIETAERLVREEIDRIKRSANQGR